MEEIKRIEIAKNILAENGKQMTMLLIVSRGIFKKLKAQKQKLGIEFDGKTMTWDGVRIMPITCEGERYFIATSYTF